MRWALKNLFVFKLNGQFYGTRGDIINTAQPSTAHSNDKLKRKWRRENKTYVWIDYVCVSFNTAFVCFYAYKKRAGVCFHCLFEDCERRNKKKLAPKTIESKKKRICGFTLWSLPSTYQNGCGTSQSFVHTVKSVKTLFNAITTSFYLLLCTNCFVCFSLSIYCL